MARIHTAITWPDTYPVRRAGRAAAGNGDFASELARQFRHPAAPSRSAGPVAPAPLYLQTEALAETPGQSLPAERIADAYALSTSTAPQPGRWLDTLA